MGTKPTRAKLETLQDIAALLQKVTAAVVKAWAAEDKKKKKTGGVNAAFVAKLRADMKALDGAKAVSTKQATQKEIAARAALRGPLQSLRDDVSETLPDDREARHAFGVGKKLSDNSTPVLLKAADDVVSAFATYGNAVAPAGVNQKRVDQIKALRAALAAADSSQRDVMGAKKATNATSNALLKSVQKRSVLVRKRLEKSAPKGAMSSTARRHTPKKRAPKPSAPPTT
ncbi:MAG TPA: hypothetical protein VGH28_20600 [Polyangiaceae bacterium]|jgi:hypothetical protein